MVERVPIPMAVSKELSELATRRAREGTLRRGWSPRSQAALVPYPREGYIGIRTTLKHLTYQNRGIQPFLMTALEGKTVPIKGRFYHVKGVGLPGMGYQDRKYEKYKGPIWREQRWRHPGIRPERFMENALSQAILESKHRMRSMVIMALLGEMDMGGHAPFEQRVGVGQLLLGLVINRSQDARFELDAFGTQTVALFARLQANLAHSFFELRARPGRVGLKLTGGVLGPIDGLFACFEHLQQRLEDERVQHEESNEEKPHLDDERRVQVDHGASGEEGARQQGHGGVFLVSAEERLSQRRVASGAWGTPPAGRGANTADKARDALSAARAYVAVWSECVKRAPAQTRGSEALFQAQLPTVAWVAGVPAGRSPLP